MQKHSLIFNKHIYWDPYTVTESTPITYPEVKCSWRKRCRTTWRTEYINYTYTYWAPKIKLESKEISVRRAEYFGEYDCSSIMHYYDGSFKVNLSKELLDQNITKCGEYKNGEIIEKNETIGHLGNIEIRDSDANAVMEIY